MTRQAAPPARPPPPPPAANLLPGQRPGLAARRDAEHDVVIAGPLARVDAGGVVIHVGVGVRLGLLEDGRVVHRPPGRVAPGPRRPLTPAAVLVAAQPGAR